MLPPMNALPFLPAKHSPVFDVESLLRVVGKLIRPVGAQAQAILVVDDALVPLDAVFFPVIKPLLHLTGMYEELQVPLLELTLAEQEVAGCDLVAESLTDLTDAERYLHTRGLQHVVVVQVNVLAGLTAQVGLHAFAFNNTDVRFHHQVEETRLRKFAAALGAFILLDVLQWQVIQAETPFTVLAIHEPVDEVLDVAAGLPYTRMSDDAAFDTDDIVIGLHH